MDTNKVYLTKRIVLRAARKGIKKASKETMDVMGYNVIVQGGWIVKKYKDGSFERIGTINISTNLGPTIID